ncbi:hypothetical protein [Clostridium sp. OS1-26]|uniref:hypothetical protein n=1 Tax=Clostridium sp. OS1-26 TaxID=3070681 RepID=UPI0027E211B0|nr:hypothetical protein [Clostridium sp. OS1-26]WML36985.1 hypothetical protein RCG18_10415 [Clostridium sp. OS1-26]
MVEIPSEKLEATAALELLYDIRDDIQQIGPMLRKSIKKEAEFALSLMKFINLTVLKASMIAENKPTVATKIMFFSFLI